jgi:hypothetical protein
VSGWEARLKKLKKISFFSLLQINIRLIFFIYFKLIRLYLILRFKNSLKTIWQFWSFFSLLQINIFFYVFVLFFLNVGIVFGWDARPKKFLNLNFFLLQNNIFFMILYFF